MQHADFVDDASLRRYDWRVTDWPAAVRLALGRWGLLWFRLAFAVLLAPTVALAVYCQSADRPALLVFAPFSVWGFRTSSTGPTGVGMLASLLVAVAGGAGAILWRDQLLLAAGALPGMTWFGSCAILGTTASYVTDALRDSEATFQLLVSRGILAAARVAQPPAEPPP